MPMRQLISVKYNCCFCCSLIQFCWSAEASGNTVFTSRASLRVHQLFPLISPYNTTLDACEHWGWNMASNWCFGYNTSMCLSPHPHMYSVDTRDLIIAITVFHESLQESHRHCPINNTLFTSRSVRSNSSEQENTTVHRVSKISMDK